MDTKGNQGVVKAQVPLSEMLSYQSTLNSITGARGSYTMELDHYDEVPALIAQKIVHKAQEEGRIKPTEEFRGGRFDSRANLLFPAVCQSFLFSSTV
jgi:elongation factor G